MKQEVAVPDIGDMSAEVIEICIASGDTVSEHQPLIVLESEKASVEIPSPDGGTVVDILLKMGDKVTTGAPILTLETEGKSGQVEAAESAPSDSTTAAKGASEESGSSASPPPPTSPPPKADSVAPPPAATATSSNADDGVYAGPAVRKLARELDVPLADVSGSGAHGRIVKQDVFQASRQGTGGDSIPKVPPVDYARFGSVQEEPLTNMQLTTARNMHRSWLNVPHVTQFDDADVTEIEGLRQFVKKNPLADDVKLTPLPFILKSCAIALQENQRINASLQGEKNAVFREYVHIGVAVDVDGGLLVPVLRDIHLKSILQINRELTEITAKARNRKLALADMQGASFTVSSLGAIGGNGFTPIVNTPESAILGVSRMQVKPVYQNDTFVPRTFLPLSLSYDHRMVNGADAGRFLTRVCELLAQPLYMFLTQAEEAV